MHYNESTTVTNQTFIVFHLQRNRTTHEDRHAQKGSTVLNSRSCILIVTAVDFQEIGKTEISAVLSLCEQLSQANTFSSRSFVILFRTSLSVYAL